MPAAELDEQCINGANLNTVPATCISNFCRFDIVLTVRFDKGKGIEAF